MVTKDDNELVYEVIRGDVNSFEILVERYQKIIYKMVLRMVGDVETAKDLTQDIFVKVFEKLGSFNWKYRFFSWIYRIAINETITWIRKHPHLDQLNHTEHLAADEQNPGMQERAYGMLDSGMQELSPDYRSLLVLKYYNQLSYEEMAGINNISVEKVRSRLFMARENLRKIMIKKGFPDYE